MTRQSTPKYEVVDLFSGTVVLTGISRTEATRIARAMSKGKRKGQTCYARFVKKSKV